MHALGPRDGTQAMIRPLLPSVGRALQDSRARVSGATGDNRLLPSVPQLWREMVRVLVDDGDEDGSDHAGLVLVALPERGPEQLAGLEGPSATAVSRPARTSP